MEAVLAGCAISGPEDEDAPWYPAGSRLQVTVCPADGWRFNYWAGTVENIDDAAGEPATVTMAGDTELTAMLTFSTDVDGDGQVDVLDVLVVRANLGKSGSSCAPPEADVNGDDVVNILDMLGVRGNLGKGVSGE